MQKIIGIICEYNPFHNGHIYHINKIKELFPDSLIIAVISTSFTMRGEISLLNKWDKTEIALNHNIDLVVELPTYYSTNSADIFAEGAITILNYLKCDSLIFGSECNNIDKLKRLANIQINNPNYDNLVKKYLKEGYNYPTSMSKSLEDLHNDTITSPNDLLGLSYIKQIILNNYSITPLTIQRTNNYHEKEIQNNITSATSIREALQNNLDISDCVPNDTLSKIIKYNYQENFYKLLKYKIISEINNLNIYVDVSEGIDKRIKKFILKSKTYNELIQNIKTKRYTYNRLNRMFIHILTNLKKGEYQTITYIKILGFNKKGKDYLKKINTNIPIITNYSQIEDYNLNYQLQTTFIYNEIINNHNLNIQELKSIPINKD